MRYKEHCWCCNQLRVLEVWDKMALCKRCLISIKQIKRETALEIFRQLEPYFESYNDDILIDEEAYKKIKSKFTKGDDGE